MANDFEHGTRKTIALTVKAEKITADIFKSALSEFLNGNSQKTGRMTFRQLENKSPSELEKIDVNSENIGDFLNVARKYDVDYALKRDKSTNPPTYRIFFSAGRTENFKKAFSEYVNKIDNQFSERGEMSREQLHKEAEKVANQPKRQQKQREKSRGICVEIPENRAESTFRLHTEVSSCRLTAKKSKNLFLQICRT